MKKEYCKNYISFLYRQVSETIMEKLENDLLKDIFEAEIFKKVFKSLVYAMNIERIEGRLLGNSAEERYDYFSETNYCIESMKNLFPEMVIQITKEIKDKILYVQSVINEFRKNKKQIENEMFQHEVGEIKKSGVWEIGIIINACCSLNLKREKRWYTKRLLVIIYSS